MRLWILRTDRNCYEEKETKTEKVNKSTILKLQGVVAGTCFRPKTCLRCVK